MICGWTTLASQCPLEKDHKRQHICQIRYEKFWVVRWVFQVYFTRHSHVTRAESQSNCIIWGMCGPLVFHLMFIFLQMEPKTCCPPGFYFLKNGWTTRFFFHVRSAAFYAHFRADTVTSESSTRIPSSSSLYSWYNN